MIFDAFFVYVLGSEPFRSQLLHIECSGFDGFQKQKTEAPVELTIYMFTKCLLSYIHNIYNIYI